MKELFKEIVRIKERLNDMGQRLSNFSEILHQSSTEQISTLQDYVVESEYEKTLKELGIEEG